MPEEIKYPSADVMLNIATSEYESEKVRTSTIDSKSGIVISLASVFFVAITQVIDLKKIFNVQITSFSSAVLPALLFLCIIGSLVVSFISLIFFLRVIFTKTYYTVDPKFFYDVKKLQNEKDLFSVAVSQFYIEATIANKGANDNRVKLYRIGMILLIISIGLFACYMSLNCFI